MIRWRAQRKRAGMIVFGLFVLALLFLFRAPVMRTVFWIARPFAALGTWVSTRAVIACEQLALAPPDTSTLEARVAALAVSDAELQTLRDENTQLREALGFSERVSSLTLAAHVVARATTERTSTFVIDRGVRDGVRKGMAVVVANGILVGKVTSEGATTSTVSVVSDPSVATAATLLNESRTIGLAEGNVSGLITLSYIPNDEIVRVNDLVLTSGLEPEMASGLVIGIVNEVKSEETAPFQTAIVEPLADMRRFTNVLVLVADAAL